MSKKSGTFSNSESKIPWRPVETLTIKTKEELEFFKKLTKTKNPNQAPAYVWNALDKVWEDRHAMYCTVKIALEENKSDLPVDNGTLVH